MDNIDDKKWIKVQNFRRDARQVVVNEQKKHHFYRQKYKYIKFCQFDLRLVRR